MPQKPQKPEPDSILDEGLFIGLWIVSAVILGGLLAQMLLDRSI